MIGSSKKAECEQHGEYQSFHMAIGDGQWTGCPHCSEAMVAEANAKSMAQAADELKESRIAARIAQTGVPRRLSGATLTTYRVDAGEAQEGAMKVVCDYARNLPAKVEAGDGLLMTGNVGTGKTHLSCALLRHAVIKHDMSAKYITAPGLFAAIRESYRGDGKSEVEIIDDLASVALLVLDEIGIGKGSEHELGVLYQLLGRRYDECRPTIMATNLTPAEFREWMGDRLADRLRENCRGVLFNWESNRGRV